MTVTETKDFLSNNIERRMYSKLSPVCGGTAFVPQFHCYPTELPKVVPGDYVAVYELKEILYAAAKEAVVLE